MLALIQTVSIFFTALRYLLIIRALMSWIVRDWSSPFPRFIRDVTEPILLPMRRLFDQLGLNGMGIDFSFLATFILLQYLGVAVVRMMYTLI